MDMSTTTLPKKGLKKYHYNIDMEKKALEKLTKDQLIELLLNKEIKKPNVVIIDDTKPVPTPRTYKPRPPVPTPRNKVSQLVQFFENKPTPPPITGKWENVKPKPVPRKSVIIDDTKPVPTPRTYKPRPPVTTPRNKVSQLVQFFENKPTPPPRTGKWENVKPKPVPRKSVNKDIILPPPIPEGKPAWESSQPKITQLQKALRNSTKSFIVDVIDNEDLLHQLNETKNFIKNVLSKSFLI